jgi:hypothetical protein
MNKQIRKMAIAVLDDDRGIGEAAWQELRTLLNLIRADDICAKVNATDDRYYLCEDHGLTIE